MLDKRRRLLPCTLGNTDCDDDSECHDIRYTHGQVELSLSRCLPRRHAEYGSSIAQAVEAMSRQNIAAMASGTVAANLLQRSERLLIGHAHYGWIRYAAPFITWSAVAPTVVRSHPSRGRVQGCSLFQLSFENGEYVEYDAASRTLQTGRARQTFFTYDAATSVLTVHVKPERGKRRRVGSVRASRDALVVVECGAGASAMHVWHVNPWTQDECKRFRRAPFGASEESATVEPMCRREYDARDPTTTRPQPYCYRRTQACSQTPASLGCADTYEVRDGISYACKHVEGEPFCRLETLGGRQQCRALEPPVRNRPAAASVYVAPPAPPAPHASASISTFTPGGVESVSFGSRDAADVPFRPTSALVRDSTPESIRPPDADAAAAPRPMPVMAPGPTTAAAPAEWFPGDPETAAELYNVAQDTWLEFIVACCCACALIVILVNLVVHWRRTR